MPESRVRDDQALVIAVWPPQRLRLASPPAALITTAAMRTPLPSWVKTGKAQCEHMFSALPLRADIAQQTRHVRFVPILLKKSFLAGGQNFSGPLMRSARGDVRDHIVLHKNDHGPSYRA